MLVITEESRLERWDIKRQQLDLTSGVIDALTESVTRKCANVIPMTLVYPGEPGTVGVALLGNEVRIFSMPVAQLPLHTRYESGTDGVLTPDFTAASGPPLPINWIPPSTMKLTLCLIVGPKFENKNQYLAATDRNQRLWRLPVSNLYEDCKLCSGNYAQSVGLAGAGGSCLQALQAAWNQFRLSKWNADLWSDSKVERKNAVKKLFRFKARGEGFEQVAVDGEWTTLCEKVGHDMLQRAIIPN